MQDPEINARQPCPVFRGRVRELNILRERARKLPAGIYAITGAPGAGKTSLLNEFVTGFGPLGDKPTQVDSQSSRQHAVHPVTPIVLETELFADPPLLVGEVQKLIREHDPWYVKFRRGAGNLLGLVGDSISLAASVGDVEVHLKALQSFREAPIDALVKPFNLLVALGKALPTGYLITIDEAQRLDESAGRDYAISLLRLLADNPTHPNVRFGNGWVVLAGLGDTVDMLRRFGITRLDVVFSLGALTKAEAVAVLTERLGDDALSQLSATGRQLVENDWIPRLAEEYRHWPHHLEGAVVALQHVASNLAVVDESFKEVQSIADQHRAVLYGQIFSALRELPFDALPAAIALAHYTLQHGDVIPLEICNGCVEIATGSNNPKQRRNAVRQLCHAGLIQSYEDFTGPPLISGYRIPIPSLRDWISQHGPPADEYRHLVYGAESKS